MMVTFTSTSIDFHFIISNNKELSPRRNAKPYVVVAVVGPEPVAVRGTEGELVAVPRAAPENAAILIAISHPRASINRRPFVTIVPKVLAPFP